MSGHLGEGRGSALPQVLVQLLAVRVPRHEATKGQGCQAHLHGELSPADVQGWKPRPTPTLPSRSEWASGPREQLESGL